MKNKTRAFLSKALSTTLVAAMILPLFPTMEASAYTSTTTETIENAQTHDWQLLGDGIFEKLAVGGEKWLHIESGVNDMNKH
ncbi:MAG: hypothetical protein RSF88_00255, partial [Lachnospiraceae bacterium]